MAFLHCLWCRVFFFIYILYKQLKEFFDQIKFPNFLSLKKNPVFSVWDRKITMSPSWFLERASHIYFKVCIFDTVSSHEVSFIWVTTVYCVVGTRLPQNKRYGCLSTLQGTILDITFVIGVIQVKTQKISPLSPSKVSRNKDTGTEICLFFTKKSEIKKCLPKIIKILGNLNITIHYTYFYEASSNCRCRLAAKPIRDHCCSSAYLSNFPIKHDNASH